jgi:dimethylargininase
MLSNSKFQTDMKFTQAIVRTPGKSMVRGLTTAGEGPPDYEKALRQHRAYIEALEQCGLTVRVLEADESFPDSTFVEDTALLTSACAIITRPGALSRRGEVVEMKRVVSEYYDDVYHVTDPGTVDAGDSMMASSHFYIGLSSRTNQEGARQVIAFLEKHGMTGSTVRLDHVLHLKTGAAYLENNNLAACGEFLEREELKKFNLLPIPEEESYAANCVWINDKVLIPAGYPAARAAVQGAGYETIVLDVSEFRKLDGGLSCLSLRF